MKIKGTFLDEISHDIPHQNWGRKEWDQDFAYMKQVGINTVILIRSGYRKWLTYPSEVLLEREKAYRPPVDLVQMFLELSEKHQMDFYFGLYDSGKYWEKGDFQQELDLNKLVIDEVWSKYGTMNAFKGWYISQECSHKTGAIIDMYRGLGEHGKSASGNLTTLISPYIDGVKNISQYNNETSRDLGVSLKKHEQDWDEIFDGIKDAIDIVAFQDGHIEFDELDDFLRVNKQLADKYGIRSWTNSETFDRDMPIKFLPIKWEKLLMKLEAAQRVGMEQAITFEFSHFMSPQSAYLQAGHLYNRYQEYLAALKG
ncbi:MAG: DUF4434 domain-containing protein [Draconibacterium sp.]